MQTPLSLTAETLKTSYDYYTMTDKTKHLKRVPAATFVDRMGAIIHAEFPGEEIDIRYKKKNRSFIRLNDTTTYLEITISDDGAIQSDFGDFSYDSPRLGYADGYERYSDTYDRLERLYYSDNDYSEEIRRFHLKYGDNGNQPTLLNRFLSALWVIIVTILLMWLSYSL